MHWPGCSPAWGGECLPGSNAASAELLLSLPAPLSLSPPRLRLSLSRPDWPAAAIANHLSLQALKWREYRRRNPLGLDRVSDLAGLTGHLDWKQPESKLPWRNPLLEMPAGRPGPRLHGAPWPMQAPLLGSPWLVSWSAQGKGATGAVDLTCGSLEGGAAVSPATHCLFPLARSFCGVRDIVDVIYVIYLSRHPCFFKLPISFNALSRPETVWNRAASEPNKVIGWS